MPIFIFLHVLTMFVAVAMAYGPAALMIAASRRGDVLALRGIAATTDRLSTLVGVVFGVGFVFGLIAVFVHDFDPFAGWLIIAYVLFGLVVLSASLFTG